MASSVSAPVGTQEALEVVVWAAGVASGNSSRRVISARHDSTARRELGWFDDANKASFLAKGSVKARSYSDLAAWLLPVVCFPEDDIGGGIGAAKVVMQQKFVLEQRSPQSSATLTTDGVGIRDNDKGRAGRPGRVA